jgi:beta-lactamase class A
VGGGQPAGSFRGCPCQWCRHGQRRPYDSRCHRHPNSVQAFGTTQLGDPSGETLNAPLVGMAATPGGGGYWLVAADGGIFSYGDATFYGSTGALHLNAPIVGMAATPGGGYWLVAADGGVFSYGDAIFYGSTGGLRLNAPIVGMASTPDGGGYWLVAADGGIFSYGDAAFYGSTGGLQLNAPIVGMASTPGGGGYWLVASDGGIFSFGGAGFFGSEGGQPLDRPVVGMAAGPGGGGYWLLASDGGIFAFGDAPYQGTALSQPTAPAIAIAAGGSDAPTGYRVAYGQASSPFGPSVTDYLAQRSGDVTATLYDAATGATWQLDPGQLEYTASIVKVDIMATALQEAQQSGQPLPQSEAQLMPPMIEQSDNDAATSMWNDVGGPDAVAQYNQNLGMTSTTPAGEADFPGSTLPGWGATTTTANDQVTLVNHFAFANPALTGASRSYGLSLMENVEPDQAWGISAGVPAGVTIALKNGWVPIADNNWQVNSIGWISGDGRDYTLAILTNGDPTEGYGIDTIEAVAATIFAELAPSS